MQQHRECLYVIGVGEVERWLAGSESPYHFEDGNGEKAMPVFTTMGLAEGYALDNMPKIVLQLGLRPLAEENIAVNLDVKSLTRVALVAEVDYVVLDPGEQQDIIRVP